jgi:hypothetical protein
MRPNSIIRTRKRVLFRTGLSAKKMAQVLQQQSLIFGKSLFPVRQRITLSPISRMTQKAARRGRAFASRQNFRPLGLRQRRS